MRRVFFKLACLLSVVSLLAIVCLAAGGDESTKAAKELADKIGDFRARGPATVSNGTPPPELPSKQ